MSAPPGHPATEPRVEQISAESDTELSTRTQQMRFLCERLGVSRRQAHHLLREYDRERDAKRASADEFGRWLRRRGDIIRVRGRAMGATWAVTS